MIYFPNLNQKIGTYLHFIFGDNFTCEIVFRQRFCHSCCTQKVMINFFKLFQLVGRVSCKREVFLDFFFLEGVNIILLLRLRLRLRLSTCTYYLHYYEYMKVTCLWCLPILTKVLYTRWPQKRTWNKSTKYQNYWVPTYQYSRNIYLPEWFIFYFEPWISICAVLNPFLN